MSMNTWNKLVARREFSATTIILGALAMTAAVSIHQPPSPSSNAEHTAFYDAAALGPSIGPLVVPKIRGYALRSRGDPTLALPPQSLVVPEMVSLSGLISVISISVTRWLSE